MYLLRGNYTKLRKSFNPAKIMVLGFIFIIAAGTLLLELPAASRDGTTVPFFAALFTATSATCVTGLTATDTALTWSLFGRVVILVLIQIGALGFMSVVTIFYFAMNKKIGLSQRLLLVKSLNLNDLQGVVKLIRHVLFGTLLFEGFGAAILWARFANGHGLWGGLGMGVFHSISAFCNAGFDIIEGAPFDSLSIYSGDFIITGTIMLLSFIGGIGFFVWEDIWRNHRFKKLHLHSKLALTISISLLVFGWVFFYFAERNNPLTIGGMPLREAVFAALFQSAMPRSCGFSIFSQSSLTGASCMVAMVLMLIGGSAGSTAGGIKNVTVGILFLSAIRVLRGRSRLSVFGRTIPESQIISAAAITVIVLTACILGSAFIVIIHPELPFTAIIFETVSAIATCGLSQGVSAFLAPAPLMIIILFMFFGRLGIITFGMATFINREKTEIAKHPDTWVLMG